MQEVDGGGAVTSPGVVTEPLKKNGLCQVEMGW